MNKRRKQRLNRAQHALEVRAEQTVAQPGYVGFNVLPGLPGGPPLPNRLEPVVEKPKSRIILPATVEKALERDAKRHDSPIGQYLKAQAFLRWGLPL